MPRTHTTVRLTTHSCERCTRTKAPRSQPLCTLLPVSKGHTVVLTLVDQLTKMVHGIPIVHLPSAEEMAQLPAPCILCLPGPLQSGTSDRSQFVSRFCLGSALAHPLPLPTSGRSGHTRESTVRKMPVLLHEFPPGQRVEPPVPSRVCWQQHQPCLHWAESVLCQLWLAPPSPLSHTQQLPQSCSH